jgi:predicted acylesterase/phospholipase RssA/CRP-like cAMP-binding protein
MDVEKVVFLRMHDCTDGLDDEAVAEIATHAEVEHHESGDVIHRPDDVMTSVYLVVGGQTRHSALNVHGQVIMERIYSHGDQLGGLAAALAEPVPVRVVSHGPSVLLKFDYQALLELTLKYPLFRTNVARMIARGAGQLLSGHKHRKKASLVAVYHESPASRELTVRLIRRLHELGEDPCLLTDQDPAPGLDGLRCRTLVRGGRALSYEEIRREVREWSDAKRIFLDLSSDGGVLNPTDVLLLCEQVFYCVRPDQWETVAERLRSLEASTPVRQEKISIVWMLDDAHQVIPAVPELRQLALEDFKLTFAEPGSRQSRVWVNGFERLVHQLRGVRIGVALGGGAARGMAHLGVLKALEQQGIAVDMIAGTSAGAMTGTMVATGIEYDYITQCFVNDLTPPWLFRRIPGGNHWYLLYKYRLGQWDSMLRKYLKDIRLEQLPVPIRAITLDLIGGRPVVRNHGDAVHAILESINLPVLSIPICREGRALVDGGLVNNVPANVLVDEGCNFVIAVSVTARLESRFGGNRPDMGTEQMKPPSTLQTALRSHMVQSMNMNSIGVQPADIVIEPDVTEFDLAEFTRTDELAAAGEKATLEAIPRIREMLAKLDGELFSSGA